MYGRDPSLRRPLAAASLHYVGANATATLSERDAMSWKWNTGPLGWKDRCSMCQPRLLVGGAVAAGFVATWLMLGMSGMRIQFV
jgi:hypothetical protein